MPLVIPTDFAQFSMDFTHTASTRVRTVTLGAQVSGNAGQPLPAVEAFRTYFGNSLIAGQMDSNSQLATIRMLYNSGALGLTSVAVAGEIGGAINAEYPPPNFCVLIRKVSGLAGRRHRGRMYWPSLVPESLVDEAGRMGQATVSAYQDLFDDWYDLMVGGSAGGVSLDPHILHTQGAGQPAPPAPTPIGTFSVQALGATQRRRMRA